MKIRLAILLVALCGVIVYLCINGFPTKTLDPNSPESLAISVSEGDSAGIKKTVSQMDLPGDEPDVEPEFALRVWRDEGDAKQRLFFEITESHGFFAETFMIEIYYRASVDGREEYVTTHFVNDFLEANGTLSGEVFIVAAELEALGAEDMGTSDNWVMEIADEGRVRAENPSADWEGWQLHENSKP